MRRRFCEPSKAFRRKASQSGVVALGCAMVLLGLQPSQTALGDNVWTDGTGSWFSPSNWSSSVPTSGVDAEINNGGTAQIAGSADAQILILGQNAGESGAVTIQSGGLRTEDGLYVADGSNSTGTVTVQNGILNAINGINMNFGSNSTGTLTIQNGTVYVELLSVAISPTSTATVNLNVGGLLDLGRYFSGGQGATLNFAGGTIRVESSVQHHCHHNQTERQRFDHRYQRPLYHV